MFECISLKLYAYGEVVATGTSVKQRCSGMKSDGRRLTHHIACAVGVDDHMRTHSALFGSKYVERTLYGWFSRVVQYYALHFVLLFAVVVERRVRYLLCAILGNLLH